MCHFFRDFQEQNSENDYDKQARLSRFSGAAAISSDAYFDRAEANTGGGGSSSRRPGNNDLDLTASELVNRLSFHVSPAVVEL